MVLERFGRAGRAAEAIINYRAVGSMAPMGDEVIRELEAAFFAPPS